MRSKDTMIVRPAPRTTNGLVTVPISGLVQWRLACVLAILNNSLGVTDARIRVSLAVRGLTVFELVSPNVATTINGSVVFAVGLSALSVTTTAWDPHHHVALPSISFDGGEEELNGALTVSSEGDTAEFVSVQTVVFDRLQYLAKRSDRVGRGRGT